MIFLVIYIFLKNQSVAMGKVGNALKKRRKSRKICMPHKNRRTTANVKYELVPGNHNRSLGATHEGINESEDSIGGKLLVD